MMEHTSTPRTSFIEFLNNYNDADRDLILGHLVDNGYETVAFRICFPAPQYERKILALPLKQQASARDEQDRFFRECLDIAIHYTMEHEITRQGAPGSFGQYNGPPFLDHSL